MAGYEILQKFLTLFVPLALKDGSQFTPRECALDAILPEAVRTAPPVYERLLRTVDHVAGMTDGFATNLYRQLMGIDPAP